MNTQWLPLMLLLLALLTGACGGRQAASGETVLSQIQTSVAITLAASTGTPAPTAVSIATGAPAATRGPALVNTATSGGTATSPSHGSSTRCNDAVYVSDVTAEDGTQFEPGETFTKTWEISNAGTCNWSKHYSMVFVSGDDMDGDDTDIDQSVDAGKTADISVELTAPDEAGTYTGYWRMADASGEVFGQKVYVEIVVIEDAATSTATPASTATTPATATATKAVNTATNTLTATDTASATPTVEAPGTETPGSNGAPGVNQLQQPSQMGTPQAGASS